MTNFIFAGDKLVPFSKARYSPFNSALFFGEGLIETIPVYGGVPLFLGDHIDRIGKGCEFLGWASVSSKRFKRAIRLFSERLDTHAQFAVRFNLVQEMGPCSNIFDFPAAVPKMFATVRPIRHNPANFTPSFGNVGICSWKVLGPQSGPRSFKWNFYMMVRQEFRVHADWDEMLCLNDDGYVADAAGSSPLWFTNRTVFVPPRRLGGLDGITRRKVQELCCKLGLKVIEKPWRPVEVFREGELVLVGSGVGIMGVSRIQGKALKTKNTFALRLWQHYREWTSGG